MPGGEALLYETVHRLIRPRATILGNEFAGVIAQVGDRVSACSVGDTVFGYNEGPFGAHAQYLAIPADGSLTTIPANLTYIYED